MDGEKKIPTTLEEHALIELYDARKMVSDLEHRLEDAKSELRFVLGFLNGIEFTRVETPEGVPTPNHYEFWFTSKTYVRKSSEDDEETDEEFTYKQIKKLIEREFGEQ